MNDDTPAQKKYLPVTERLENNHPVARKIKTSKEYKTYPKRYYEPKMQEKTKVKYCNVCCNGMLINAWNFCETCCEIARQKGEN
tara:strand:+ start:543 stop:794 length:252 start_codon:yes stop_codon:yes gene_type:complete